MKTKFKFINYAYATSTTARKFGYAKTGCYTVDVRDSAKPAKPAKTVKAFLTLQEAKDFVKTLDLPACPILGKYYL